MSARACLREHVCAQHVQALRLRARARGDASRGGVPPPCAALREEPPERELARWAGTGHVICRSRLVGTVACGELRITTAVCGGGEGSGTGRREAARSLSRALAWMDGWIVCTNASVCASGAGGGASAVFATGAGCAAALAAVAARAHGGACTAAGGGAVSEANGGTGSPSDGGRDGESEVGGGEGGGGEGGGGEGGGGEGGGGEGGGGDGGGSSSAGGEGGGGEDGVGEGGGAAASGAAANRRYGTTRRLDGRGVWRRARQRYCAPLCWTISYHRLATGAGSKNSYEHARLTNALERRSAPPHDAVGIPFGSGVLPSNRGRGRLV
jgi:hypothetical protein